jgi:hypothetical protein
MGHDSTPSYHLVFYTTQLLAPSFPEFVSCIARLGVLLLTLALHYPLKSKIV